MLKLYEIRERNDWSHADTVYDVYLIVMKRPRRWFNMEMFQKAYPDWEEQVNQNMDDEETCDDESDDASELSIPVCRKRKRQVSETEESELEEEEEGRKDEEDENLLQNNEDEDKADMQEKERYSKMFKLKKEVVDTICISDSDENGTDQSGERNDKDN